MITQVKAIKNFLDKKTWADVSSWYNEGMEVQVMCDSSKGEREESEWKGKKIISYRAESGELFKSFRIPYKANTEPEFDLDKEMRWDLAKYAVGIGCTGWNWKQKVSKYFMYDFDDIIGHSANHAARLTDSELEEVKKKAQEIPWVTIRKSTGGAGLHLYVFVDDVPTSNHNEHAALARSILGKMSAVTGFNFEAKVDVCGHIAWMWHKKLDKSNGEGLKLIKQGETLKDIPANWRDHLDVVKGTRTRLKAGKKEGEIDDIVAAQNFVTLDDTHKELFKFLDDEGAHWYWEQDRKMLVASTLDLKKAYDELGYVGFFDTISTGSSDVNAFCFPIRGGAWSVRRYSKGVSEHESWLQDPGGWTRCFLNQEVDFRTACRAYGGLEVPDKKEFEFEDAEHALKAADLLGERLSVDPTLISRPTRLKRDREGRLVAEILWKVEDQKTETMKGWRVDPRKKIWTRVFDKKVKQATDDSENIGFDDQVRHILSASGADAGWTLNIREHWAEEPLAHIKLALESMNIPSFEVKKILGKGVLNSWRLVNEPFKEEYPGDRVWNRDSAKLGYKPDFEKEILSHPTWDKMLGHLGKNLDVAVKDNPWCKMHGLKTGGDYLFHWLAAMIKEAEQPLPYLFFFGGQNTGKSTLHEMLPLLFSKGIMRADEALKNDRGFNFELDGCVLAIIEEVDLSKSDNAYNRMKDWTTSPTLSIHRKGCDPYMAKNYLHFIQVSNHVEYCPISDGDTRIVMAKVDSFPEGQEVAKHRLRELLRQEAQDFVTSIMKLDLPTHDSRMRIPVLDTSAKKRVISKHQSPLEKFIKAELVYMEGSLLEWGSVHKEFLNTLDPMEVKAWGKIRTGEKLPMDVPKGKLRRNNKTYIGNYAFREVEPTLVDSGRWEENNGFLELME